METNTILLVEDDFLNRRLSRKTLAENGYRILEAKNAKEALELLKKEKIARAILDINLGENEQDGVTLGHELQTRYAVPFIYLTAYDTADIIKKAIATTPYAYITKPFKNIDLLTSVALAVRLSEDKHQHKPSILVKDGEYNVDLNFDDIDYIESDGNYLLFHTAQKTYKARYTIRQIMDTLPASGFIQVHRAFVVNKARIDKFNIKSIVVDNNVIPVSKNYVDDISKIYK
jgi:DNA-binding LytR/AlgR family response regulator